MFNNTLNDWLDLREGVKAICKKFPEDYWREIGDKLYDFHSKDVNKSIEVNLEKFQRILQTLKKLNIIYAVGFKSN